MCIHGSMWKCGSNDVKRTYSMYQLKGQLNALIQRWRNRNTTGGGGGGGGGGGEAGVRGCEVSAWEGQEMGGGGLKSKVIHC